MFSSKGENYNPCWGGKAYLKSDSCHPAPPPPTSVTIFHHPTLTGRNRKHYCVALTDPPRLRERKKYYWKQYEHSVVALDSLYVRINPRIQLCTTGYSNMNKISKILQLYTAASFSRVTPNQELNLFFFFWPSVADCKFCVQDIHRLGSTAEITGHPGVYGAQQSGPVPEGGAGDHYWPAHASSSRVWRTAVSRGPLFRACWSYIRDYASSVTITKLTKTKCSVLLCQWALCFSLCSGRIRIFRLTLSQWLMRSSWKPPRTRDRYKQKHTTHIFSWCPFLLLNCTKGMWYDEWKRLRRNDGSGGWLYWF